MLTCYFFKYTVTSVQISFFFSFSLHYYFYFLDKEIKMYVFASNKIDNDINPLKHEVIISEET